MKRLWAPRVATWQSRFLQRVPTILRIKFEAAAPFFFPFFSKMRVVILNQHPGLDFCVFICFVTGSECMDAPFFLKGQYIEKVTRENLFFPWRSLMSTFDPLYECKSRKYSLFWTEGNFGGKGRTPGERLPKCLEWTQWCSSKPLGPQHGLLRRKFIFKTQKFQKWPLFCTFLCWKDSTWEIRVIFENFEICKRIFYSTSYVVDPRA